LELLQYLARQLKGLEKYGYPVISEETNDSNERLKSDKVWIVDPIDGTNDFINQTDEFCILIGLAEKGKSVLGVVYQPSTKKTYFAENTKIRSSQKRANLFPKAKRK
jgi:3'-phosphoadenosine 5'-phosphosulfate (PAPS) 3'-phosphatase